MNFFGSLLLIRQLKKNVKGGDYGCQKNLSLCGYNPLFSDNSRLLINLNT